MAHAQLALEVVAAQSFHPCAGGGVAGPGELEVTWTQIPAAPGQGGGAACL